MHKIKQRFETKIRVARADFGTRNMLSYSHHKKEIKNLSYDGLFLYFLKQEVWGMHILTLISLIL
jgi:hypothetical protein